MARSRLGRRASGWVLPPQGEDQDGDVDFQTLDNRMVHQATSGRFRRQGLCEESYQATLVVFPDARGRVAGFHHDRGPWVLEEDSEVRSNASKGWEVR
jgi:hypothetical protein